MPQRIHFIEKLDLIKKVQGNVFDSGFWDVPAATAEALIGGDIYFHRKQKEPSYFGGKITGYRISEADAEYPGRVIFRFEYSSTHRGVSAGGGGWSYEKKIVR